MLAGLVTLVVLWLLAGLMRYKGWKWSIPVVAVITGAMLARMDGWPGIITANVANWLLGVGPWLSARIH